LSGLGQYLTMCTGQLVEFFGVETAFMQLWPRP